MYFFKKRKISKDQEAFVRSTIEDFKSQVSKYQIPKISFLTEYNVQNSTSQELSSIIETFGALRAKITKINELIEEHTEQQKKNYSSFRSKQEYHEEQVNKEIYTEIFNYLQLLVKQINDNYKIAKNELNIFILYQNKLSELLLELKKIKDETKYKPEQNDILNKITISVESLEEAITKINNLPNPLTINNTTNDPGSLYTLLNNLAEQLMQIILTISDILKLFKKTYMTLTNSPSTFEIYILKITDLWLTTFMNSLTNEKNLHHIPDKPKIARYAEIHLNSYYTRLDNKFREAIDAFSKTTTNSQLNAETKRLFNEIYSSFNSHKANILAYRDRQINDIYTRKAEQTFTDIIEQKILKDYNSGNYQEILRTIIDLDNNQSNYIDEQITSAKNFPTKNEYLFHGISNNPFNNNGH